MKNIDTSIARVFIGVILALFFLFGFVIEQPCNGIDQSSLYCALHPLTFIKVLGSILFTAAAVFLSGIWEYVWPDEYMPTGSSWPVTVAAVSGMLGILLIFI